MELSVHCALQSSVDSTLKPDKYILHDFVGVPGWFKITFKGREWHMMHQKSLRIQIIAIELFVDRCLLQ